MSYKDSGTRHVPAAAGLLHSPRRTCLTVAHRLLHVSERGCCQGKRLGVHPTRTPPHTPRAGQSAHVATRVTGGELRLSICLLPVVVRADAFEGVV